MNPQQKQFAIEYCVDFHVTNAAIRAGYSERSAYAQGSRLLKNDEIKQFISDYIEEYAVSKLERLKLMSDLARNEKGDVPYQVQYKAINDLGQLAGDYTKKIEHSGGVNIPQVKYIKENRG